jgi:hypothetical protein
MGIPVCHYGGLNTAVRTLDDDSHEGAQGRKCPLKEDVHRRKAQGGGPKRGPRKKVVRPFRRREMAQKVVRDIGIPIRLACAIFSVSETCYRYEAKSNAENELIRLTDNNRSWGFGLCYLYLRNVKNFTWNHKRIYQIYRALELNLRIKLRKRLVRDKPDVLVEPLSINPV